MDAIKYILTPIDDLIEKHEDPRSKNWLGMASVYPTIFISIFYLISIKLGIKYMKNRQPIYLNNMLIAYNAFQVVLSTYLFYNLSIHGWVRTGKLLCDPMDFSQTPSMMALAHAGWWYYFAKFTEFIDTYFFIVRKKNNQISTLHVFHHTVMPMVAWCGVKFSNGGSGSHYGVVNSFVHIIMYTYYMLAAMGTKYQKYIWWKKYLTIIQLTQFVLLFIHALILVFMDCKINKLFSYIIISAAGLFFIQFGMFYQKAYNKKDTKVSYSDMNQNKMNSSIKKK